MNRRYSPFTIPRRWQWIVKPVFVTGTGGTALAPLLEEGAVAAVELFPLAALPGMAGILFWFNHQLFRTTHPDKHPSQGKQS